MVDNPIQNRILYNLKFKKNYIYISICYTFFFILKFNIKIIKIYDKIIINKYMLNTLS